MPLRPHFLHAVDGVLDFAIVMSTTILQRASSVQARIRGAGPEDDESDDPNGYEEANAELWGLASVLYRPQDGAEVVMHRRGDERVVLATKDRRWQSEHTLEKGDVVLRWCGDTGGSGPAQRPYVHLKANGDVLINGVKVRVATSGDVEIDADATVTITGNKIVAASNDIRLTGDGATDALALASKCNARLDAISAALDAFAAATPVPNDGGAFIQTQLKVAGGWGTGPHAPANTGSSKVKAT